MTDESPLRRLLLALLVLGGAGLVAELLLLEHWDSPWQLTPFVLLAAALATLAVVARRPGPRALAALRAVMGLCVAAGGLGIILHYRGNVEFELERDSGLRGVSLFWEAIRGATPSLAPGALTQLGLLGLIYAHRHPAGRSPSSTRGADDPSTPARRVRAGDDPEEAS